MPDAACRARTIRALYVMPTLHNPTTITMPEGRRREIVESADATNSPSSRRCLRVLKDRPCRPRHPCRSWVLPVIRVESFAPGLRIGFIHAPRRGSSGSRPQFMPRSYDGALMTAIVTQWFSDGTGARLAGESGSCGSAAVAGPAGAGDRRLGTVLMTDPAPHCWLTLPPGWQANEFVAVAWQPAVTTAFAMGRRPLVRRNPLLPRNT